MMREFGVLSDHEMLSRVVFRMDGDHGFPDKSLEEEGIAQGSIGYTRGDDELADWCLIFDLLQVQVCLL
jgi:hypothetical protein